MTSDELRPFLTENLPERFELAEGEVITDALVIIRVLDLDAEGGMPERYEYTTTSGLSFVAARGMVDCVQDQIRDFYIDCARVVGERDDEED